MLCPYLCWQPVPTVGLRPEWVQKSQSALPSTRPPSTISLKKRQRVCLKLIPKPSQHLPNVPRKELSGSSLTQAIPHPKGLADSLQKETSGLGQTLLRIQLQEELPWVPSHRTLAEQFEPLWHLQKALTHTHGDKRKTECCKL